MPLTGTRILAMVTAAICTLKPFTCGLFFLAAAGPIAPQFSPEQLVKVGKSYADRGQDDRAIEVLEQALRLGPTSADEAEYTLGVVHSRKRRLAESAEHLERSLRLNPKRYEAWLLLGMTKDLLKDALGASRVYRRAIEQFPDRAEAHRELGGSLLLLGRPEEAVAELRTSLRLLPGQADALGELGYALLLRRKCDQAAAVLQEARTLDLRSPDIAAHLGDALACLGKTDEAITAYEAALARAPDNARALFHLGLMHSKNGDKARARAALERAATLDASNPKIGQALRRLGP